MSSHHGPPRLLELLDAMKVSGGLVSGSKLPEHEMRNSG